MTTEKKILGFFRSEWEGINVAQSREETVFQKQEAIGRLSAELNEIFFRVFGKEPNPEIIREEAESIVLKYGVIAGIKDIFNV